MTAPGMADIAVSILRWVDGAPQPGLVEAALVDCDGRDWHFIDKQVYFTAEQLDATSTYPKPGATRCKILSCDTDASGRAIAEIDTGQPWSIQAIDGTHVFRVVADQLDRSVPQNEKPERIALIPVAVITAEKKK